MSKWDIIDRSRTKFYFEQSTAPHAKTIARNDVHLSLFVTCRAGAYFEGNFFSKSVSNHTLFYEAGQEIKLRFLF